MRALRVVKGSDEELPQTAPETKRAKRGTPRQREMLRLRDVQPSLCSCIEGCLNRRGSWVWKKKKKEYIICFLAERGNPLGTSADCKATPLESIFSPRASQQGANASGH